MTVATRRYVVKHVAIAGCNTTFCGKERKIGTALRNRCLLCITSAYCPTKTSLERTLSIINTGNWTVCPRCIDRINTELILLSIEGT